METLLGILILGFFYLGMKKAPIFYFLSSGLLLYLAMENFESITLFIVFIFGSIITMLMFAFDMFGEK